MHLTLLGEIKISDSNFFISNINSEPEHHLIELKIKETFPGSPVLHTDGFMCQQRAGCSFIHKNKTCTNSHQKQVLSAQKFGHKYTA